MFLVHNKLKKVFKYIFFIFLFLNISYTLKAESIHIQVDSLLEQEIEILLKEARNKKILSETESISIVIYDLLKNKKMVSINENKERMAASIIKKFIMLAYFHQVEYKELKHTKLNEYKLEHMIRLSSNHATNYILKLIGGPKKANNILKQYYSFFKHTKIKEYIPNNGRTYLNTTSVQDLNTFYIELWDNKLPYSDVMKYYLNLSNTNYLYAGRSSVYNKTGTVYGLIGDSGIIELNPINNSKQENLTPVYIFSILIEDKVKTDHTKRKLSYEKWRNQRISLIRQISREAYNYFR